MCRWSCATCWRCADTVGEATEVLRRLPHQISYNITLCDRSGAVATVYIAPDRPARVTEGALRRPTTPVWSSGRKHSTWVRSVERLEAAPNSCNRRGSSRPRWPRGWSRPPLLARQWDAGFATLFTAAYRPVAGTLTYHWPNQTAAMSLADPVPTHLEVAL